VSQREGHFEDALAAYHGLASAEASLDAPDARRALIVALRRLARPAVLDAIVRLAVRRVPADPQAVFVLQRAGDDAVPAIVERIVGARSSTMRQQLLQVLRQLPAAGSGLGTTVGTARPVLARQAARLAAELALGDAEHGLAQAAEQASPEVRREALAALATLAGPRAVDAHLRGLRDDEVIVRLQAAGGLVKLKPPGVVAALASALNDEAEPEVQVALVQAIGRVALPESVEPLTKAAEPAKGLFRKKSLALRVAAVLSLAQLRLPGVSAVLQGLSQDKERAVRDALAQATRVHGRRTTRAMQAIPG
jgi:HEAT repeat protein